MVDRKKLLIVEDDRYISDYMRRALAPLGHTLYFASNGLEAFDLVAGELPDLIILDLMMPNISGVDFCRSYRSNPLLKQVPILVVSSQSIQYGLIDIHPSWISGYLEKPFNRADLVSQVEALLASGEEGMEPMKPSPERRYYKIVMECGGQDGSAPREVACYVEADSTIELFENLKEELPPLPADASMHITLVKPVSRQEFESADVVAWKKQFIRDNLNTSE